MKVEMVEGGLKIACKHCGKPIVYSDEKGMFCEDRCNYRENREAKGFIEELCQDMAKLANDWKKRSKKNE